jgi:uncharacterized membrane protein YqjE
MTTDRDFRDILADLKNELLESAKTRFDLFKEELHERAIALKESAPLVLAAAVFLTTAFLLFTAVLVVLVAAAFPPNLYRWVFATLIVAVVWAICGSAALYLGSRRMKMQAMLPVKTLQVFHDDKSRLQDSTRRAA